MTAPTAGLLSRRAVLSGTGALLLSFRLPLVALGQEAASDKGAQLPGSLGKTPLLDAWIRVEANGHVTAFTGKAELGQGLKTALLQVVAEELELTLDQLSLVTADTATTPNEGFTAGSHSLQDSGTALRNAAAQVREILVAEAARQLKVPPAQLHADGGAVVGANGLRIPYGTLVSDQLLHVQAQPASRLKDPNLFRLMNKPVHRVDIPAKVSGGAAYVQDMRLPGMLHARVVRPPSYAAQLTGVDTATVERIPGVVKVVRNGNFLAVIADREYASVKALRALTLAARWNETPTLPDQQNLPAALLAMPADTEVILDREETGANPTATTGEAASASLSATYTRPYLSHGSIGPSCAIGQFAGGVLTIWSHTQGAYPDRAAIAEMLHLPADKVRCIHVEGSGCYGHNGADDAAADAGLLATELPGKPVRVQWMREQEHAWEPFGPAMVARARATLSKSGHILDWEYAVWSNTHATRPGPAGSLLAALHIQPGFTPPEPRPLPQPEGGGDRNAIPLYTLAKAKVTHHFLPTMPVRVSALRSLGAHMNVYAIESFIDELAQLAGTDPVAFRMRHLDDARARDVINAAAEDFRWTLREAPANGYGYGFAFARYKNLAAYCAVALQVHVDRDTGRARVLRVAAAVDTGQVVNPDGVRNQIEGGIIQSLSWSLFESVSFDSTRITSVDWSTYPILRFDAVPDEISVRILGRPGTPFLGCGEAAQGPAAAALANAIANATGTRIRDLPLNALRLRTALAN